MDTDAGQLMELELTEKFREKFKLGKVLGRGGMGVVYQGFQKELNNRPVAIKFLREDYAQQDPTALRRFIDEGKICSSLSHPNVVRLYLNESDNLLYLVYEFIDGQSLEDLLENSPHGCLPLREGLLMAIQICRGLGHAHEKGVVHRDIKPANILVENGTSMAKLTDFGIARNPLTGARTKTGIVVGTPAYMAPEQCRGEKNLDARTDVYAVCAMIYEMLSGRLPYPGQGIEIVRHHVDPKSRPMNLSQVKTRIPQAVSVIVHRGLEKDREDRWRDGNELADALEEVLDSGVQELKTMKGSLDEVIDSLEGGTKTGQVRASTGGATVQQPSMRKSLRKSGRAARGKTSVRKPMSSMAISAVAEPSENKGPLIIGVLCALVFMACLGFFFLTSSPSPDIDTISITLAENELSLAWRTKGKSSCKLRDVKGLTAWKLKSDGSENLDLLHQAKVSFKKIKSGTIQFDILHENEESINIVLPVITMELQVFADRKNDLSRAKWSFPREVAVQIPGKQTESIKLTAVEGTFSCQYIRNDDLLVPVLTGRFSGKNERLAVDVSFANYPHDASSNTVNKISFPTSLKADKSWLYYKEIADKFFKSYEGLELTGSLRKLFDLKETQLGLTKTPELPKPRSDKWEKTQALLEEFCQRKYQKGIAVTLINPLLVDSERERLKEAVEHMQIMLNRMAAQSLLVDKDPFWRPRTNKWRDIHGKNSLSGTDFDTVGFWVPTVFLADAFAPIFSIKSSYEISPPRWDSPLVKKIELRQSTLSSYAEKSLLSANLYKKYALKNAAADYLPNMSKPFKDMNQDFIDNLVSRRTVKHGFSQKEGYVCLRFKTWFFDVISTLRITMGKRKLFLLPKRATDLRNLAGGFLAGLGSGYKDINFTPDAVGIKEEPTHWYVKFPAHWLAESGNVIVFDSLCIGLPSRIGTKARTSLELGIFKPSANSFINMTVLSEIECYEMKSVN